MPLSTFGRQTAYASATKEIWFYLVTIEHPDLPATLRFVARKKGRGRRLQRRDL
jgi:hypothetical protein